MLPFISPNNITNLWPVSQLTGTATLNAGGGVQYLITFDDLDGFEYFLAFDDLDGFEYLMIGAA